MRAFFKILLIKVCLYFIVPDPWSLPKAIKILSQLVNLVFSSIFIVKRLIYIHIFHQFTMKECTLDIKLVYLPLFAYCESENNFDGVLSCHRSKDFVVIYAMLLRVPFIHKVLLCIYPLHLSHSVLFCISI